MEVRVALSIILVVTEDGTKTDAGAQIQPDTVYDLGKGSYEVRTRGSHSIAVLYGKNGNELSKVDVTFNGRYHLLPGLARQIEAFPDPKSDANLAQFVREAVRRLEERQGAPIAVSTQTVDEVGLARRHTSSLNAKDYRIDGLWTKIPPGRAPSGKRQSAKLRPEGGTYFARIRRADGRVAEVMVFALRDYNDKHLAEALSTIS